MCFDNFLRSLGPILGSLGRLWDVLMGLGGLLAPSWGLLEELLEILGCLVRRLEVAFRSSGAVLEGISHSALDFDPLWVSWR